MPEAEVVWVRDSTGVITARVLAEKDNPKADVIWVWNRYIAGNSAEFFCYYDVAKDLQGVALERRDDDPAERPVVGGRDGGAAIGVVRDPAGERSADCCRP